MTDGPESFAPRKLTYDQARAELRLYWSRKSVPERLAAMTALNERVYKPRGIDLDDSKNDWTARHVSRRRD
jgi:hypothetical protein